MQTKTTCPRQLAVLTLEHAEKRGDFLGEVLDFHLGAGNLSQLDRGLYTELVYGSVRMRRTLDHALAQFSSRPLPRIEPRILQNLRVAAYQLLYLERVPAFAAVNEAVRLAHLFGHQGTARFTNGLLRQLSRNKDKITYPSFEEQPVRSLGLRYSFPDWIIAHWLKWWGREETEALCRALNRSPRFTLRVNTLKQTVQAVAEHLEARGAKISAGHFAPEILEVEPAHLAIDDPFLTAGKYYVQDESSALAAHALGALPGDTVYDLCSAPGGKTTHLAQLMQNCGKIMAYDLDPARLELVHQNVSKLGITNVQTRQGDAGSDLGLPPAPRVLVDAPCSGLGTMGHRPDLRWRRRLAELPRLVALQKQILSRAARYVEQGGVLLYSTCTLSKLENEDVAEWFLQAHPEFAGRALPSWFPPASAEPPWQRTFFPHHHDLDGFFLALFTRK